MKVYPITIVAIVIMCLMIYTVFEVPKSDLVYAVDNTSNVVQSMKDFSASELGKDSARFMVDVGGNTIKGVNKYIMSEVGSSQVTQSFDVIFGNGILKIFGISGNSVESIVDSLVRATKSEI